MEPSDIEARDYDLGTTSVRLVKLGSMIQLLHSNMRDAAFLFAELSPRFKRIQDVLDKRRG